MLIATFLYEWLLGALDVADKLFNDRKVEGEFLANPFFRLWYSQMERGQWQTGRLSSIGSHICHC